MLAIRCVVAFILLCSVFVSSFSDAASYIRPVSASASSSYGSGTPSKAIDGNASTTWNAGGSATRWITVDLGAQYQISYVRMRVNQHPSGQTTHRVYAGASSSGMSYVTQLSGNTSSGQWLTASGNYGTVRYIKVETTQSPSWVAWFEIQPYGTVPPPARPSGVSINPSTVHTSQNFSMSWGNVSGASRYVIQRSTNNYHWYSAATVYSNSASFNESSPGSYYYRVSACNSSGSCSSYSSSRSVNVITPPPGPLKSSFDGTIFDAQTMSGWACEVGSGSSVYYKIYSQNSSGNLDQVLHEGWANASSSGAIHNSSNCNANGSFRFHWYMTNTEIANHCGKTMRLRAYRNQQDSNPRLDVYSRSISCDAETKAGSISIPSQTVIKGNSYSVNWSGFSGPISKYYLEEKYEGGPWSNIATISSSSGSGTRTIGGKSSKGRYYYRVKACGAFSACTDWVEPNGGSVLIGDDIIGSLDGPAPYPAIIAGWACARGSSDSLNIEIRKLSDGQVVHSAVANLQSEPAISSASNCNAQGQYRFLWEMSYAQQQLMCNQAMSLYAYTSDNPADKRQVVGTKTGICPGTISAPSASVNIGSSFDVTWDNFGGPVQKYILEESTSGGAWSNVADNITPATSSYTIAAKSQAGDFKYRVKACYSSVLCTDFSESNQVSVEKLGTGEIKGWFDGTAGGLGTLAGWVCEVENPSALQIKLYELDENDNEVAVRHQQSTDIATNPSGPIASAEFCKAAGDYHFNWSATAESCGKTFRLKAVLDGQEHTVIPDRLLACNESEIIKLGSYVNLNEDYPIQWALFQAGQDTYELEESFEGGAWTLRSKVHSRVTKLTIPGKTVLGKYRYRIRGCDLNNQCTDYKYSNFITVIDTVPGAIKGYFDGTAGGLGTLSGWACKVNDQTPMQVKLYEVDDNGTEVAVRHTQTTNIFADENSELTSPEFCNVTGNFHFKWSPSLDQCRKTFRVKAVDGSTEQVVGPDRYLACNSSEVIKLPASAKVNESYPLEWAIFEPEIHKFEVQDRFEDGPWVLRHDIHSRVTKLQIPGKQNTGRYQYRIRGCKLDGNCTAYRLSNYIVINSNDNPGPLTPAALPADPSGNGGIIPGASAGSFRVSESGAATYSMPIMAAAGVAGVSPEVSLNYSSQAGNGPVGMGWSIGGLSAISRCRQTLSIDGAARPISWTDSDRYCLDGQRLLLESGTYGADGSQYRTEIDSFALISQLGSGVNRSFRVERKDGSVSTYGSVTDAKQVMANGSTMTWYLDEFKDSVGNAIEYHYSNNQHFIYPSSIRYAFGASGHLAEITFDYLQSRSDASTAYVAGQEYRRNWLLTNIKSYSNGILLRDYALNYSGAQDASKLARLESLRECDGESTPNCFAPTQFDWELSGAIALVDAGNSDGFLDIDIEGLNVVDFKTGDINGDGLTDMIWLMAYFNEHGRVSSNYLLYSLGNKNDSAARKPVLIYSSKDLQTRSLAKPYKIAVFDYNNDGASDIAMFRESEASDNNDGEAGDWPLFTKAQDVNGEFTLKVDFHLPFTERSFVFSDIDSDGLVDAAQYDEKGKSTSTEYYLLKRNNSNGEYPYSYSNSNKYVFPTILVNNGQQNVATTVRAPAGDLNGDGRIDFVLTSQSEVESSPDVYTQIPYGLYLAVSSGNGIAKFDGDTKLPFLDLENTLFQDINQDGNSDILYWDEGTDQWKLGLNTGKAIAIYQNIGLSAANSSVATEQEIKLVDTNKDGYLDLVWRVNDQLKTRLWSSSSNSFEATQHVLKSVLNSGKGNLLFDYNGDGAVDLLSFKNDKFYWSKGTPALGQINKISNGLGAETDIAYQHLGSGSVYQRANHADAQCDFQCQTVNPFSNLNNGLQNEQPLAPAIQLDGAYTVVASVSSSAPIKNNPFNKSYISYKYGMGLIQAAGRGLLGFAKLTTIDGQTGVSTTTQYRQDWPFVGYPQRTVTKDGGGRLLSESTNKWALQGFQANWPSAARIRTSDIGPLKPYIQQSTELSYSFEENDSQTGLPKLLAKVVTDNTYDGFGNVETIEISNFNGGGSLLQKKTTQNSYMASGFSANESKRLGRLSRTEVTTERGGLTQNRVSTFTYYSSGFKKGLLHTESIEPNAAQAHALTKEHFYDSFGNKVKTQSYGWDGVANITRYSDIVEYDLDGRYPVLTKRVFPGATGERTVATVNSRNRYGAVSQATDQNGVSAQTYFGPMGRQYASDSDISAWSRVYVESSDSYCPHGTALVRFSEGADGKKAKECFDVLMRSTRKLGLDMEGKWVAIDTHYDELGRTHQVSEPFYMANVSSAAAYYTTNQYDILGRIKRTDAPNNNWLTVSYLGLQTQTRNAKNQVKTELKNALGELVLVTDANGTNSNFRYDVNGNLDQVSFVGLPEKTVTIGHDKLGRKLSMSDPDKGDWEYRYNAFGELIWQRDAKLQSSSMRYDALGRMSSRDDHDGQKSYWYYDTAVNGLGQLAEVKTTAASGSPDEEYSKQFQYDGYGRAIQTNYLLKGAGIENDAYFSNISSSISYDAFGRVGTVNDVAANKALGGNGLLNIYNAFGYLVEVADEDGSKPIFARYMHSDVRGNITRLQLGNGIVQTQSYYAATGLAQSISASSNIQNLSYQWDVLGNLSSRTETSASKNLSESFVYDDVNRLEKVTSNVAGQSKIVDISYDAAGNILSKSDVGTYSYDGRPHGVSATTKIGTNGYNNSYSYDANGSVESISGDSNRTFKYTSFDKVREITKPASPGISEAKTQFWYDADRSRYKRVDNKNGSSISTYYFGNVEIKKIATGHYELKRQVAGVAVQTINVLNGVAKSTEHYLHKDHLGSIDVITDASGNVAQEMSFDAWGARRNAVDWNNLDLAATVAEFGAFKVTSIDFSSVSVEPTAGPITNRGYTGHEMLDDVGIIHMNGRIYDARLGRFLQADSIIQAPGNTQSYNRYSYVVNNPLKYTDPSGYVFGLAVGLIAKFAFAATAVEIGIAVGVATFAQVLAQGGSFGDALKSGIISGVAAGAFSGLGEANLGGTLLGKAIGETATRVLAFGAVGGITSTLNGGKFGHGFVSAGLGAAAGSISGLGGSGAGAVTGRIAVGAVVGGTASKITGGKFANGAAYGAFAAALSEGGRAYRDSQTNNFIDNNVEHYTATSGGDVASPVPSELRSALMRYGRSSGGARIISHALDTDATVTFIDTGVNGDFQAYDNTIEYTTGSSWYDADEYSLGQNLPRPGLDVVIAHEFGHTNVGHSAFGLSSITVRSRFDSSTNTTYFNGADIDAREIRATRLFENPYRAHRGLELRRNYHDLPIPQ
ncbi:MAG: discoidin domain-containing protein [Cellvibrionaceae bacterium]|nr:discoidin domain-containing protein [Cellvibrionaceae bacterium]